MLLGFGDSAQVTKDVSLRVSRIRVPLLNAERCSHRES